MVRCLNKLTIIAAQLLLWLRWYMGFADLGKNNITLGLSKGKYNTSLM